MSTIYYLNIDLFFEQPPPFLKKLNNRYSIITDPGRFSQYRIQFYSFVQFHQVKKNRTQKKTLWHKFNKKRKKIECREFFQIIIPLGGDCV
jgi:hypothetical protein